MLLWCDGFDHYGADTAVMLDGVWAELSSNFSLSDTNPRTGARSLRYSGVLSSGEQSVRRVFGAALTTAGFGFAFYMVDLPAANDRLVLAQFRDINNIAQLTIQVLTTGAIRVELGNGTTNTLTGTHIVDSDDAVVTAGAYQHFECRVAIHDSTGAVEVRINGVTVISETGIDTKATSEADVRQVVVGKFGAATTQAPETFFDDMFVWDTSGSQNNDFIGDRRVLTLFPDQDTAQADWAVEDGASPPGAGYEAINDVPPDDDSSYVYADTVNDVSEFGFEDLPEGVSVISAVQLVNRMRKDDAGDCNVQASLVATGSPAGEANGADRPITEVYTYWQDVIELNPGTGAPWTPTELDAALLKLERTA